MHVVISEIITFCVITLCVRKVITICVERLLHFALKILLHFASMLLHFALVLHFAAILITFCVNITFCGVTDALVSCFTVAKILKLDTTVPVTTQSKVPDVSRRAFETFGRYLKIENERLC